MILFEGGAWFKVDGASDAAIFELQRMVGVPLLDEYIELLKYSNGGEGDLPPPFYGFCLDTAEQASDPEQLKISAECYPGLFVIGGDGGAQLYAFDMRGDAPFPIVSFDGVDPFASMQRVADSFAALMFMIGNP